MPGFRSRSVNATPVWLADDDGNPVSAGGGSASGPQPASGSQSVTPASNGSAFPINAGEIITPSDNVGNSVLIMRGTGGSVAPLASFSYVYNPVTTAWDRTPGTARGSFVIGKGGDNIATAQVAVAANTATLVAAARVGRQKATVSPTTSAAFYQGGSTVSATTGLFVPAGSSKTTDTAAAIYVFSTTAITVSVKELY